MARLGHDYDHLSDYTNRMYAALGNALDTWGNVEAQLASIFCAVMEAKNADVALAAYTAIHSLEVQIAIVDGAVLEAVQNKSEVLLRWKVLRKKARDLRLLRNKLAHGRTIIIRKKEQRNQHERRFLPFFQYYTH